MKLRIASLLLYTLLNLAVLTSCGKALPVSTPTQSDYCRDLKREEFVPFGDSVVIRDRFNSEPIDVLEVKIQYVHPRASDPSKIDFYMPYRVIQPYEGRPNVRVFPIQGDFNRGQDLVINYTVSISSDGRGHPQEYTLILDKPAIGGVNIAYGPTVCFNLRATGEI